MDLFTKGVHMYKYAEKHPILFEIILIIVSFLLAGIGVLVGSIFDLDPDLSTSLARIAVAIILLLVFHKAFKNCKLFGRLLYLLPILLIPVWNLYYNLSSGTSFATPDIILKAVITALAPALFEEVIFRGIFIYNLRKNDYKDSGAMLMSAIVFALFHLTNIVGGNVLGTLIQTVYSFVIGLVLAALYLKNGSLFEIVLIHFLIDLTNRIYIQEATSASNLQLVIFAILLVVETVYAFYLVPKEKQ